MPVVGTAGHVDHGKSTLIEALTGRDPDRWAEEKDRGLTIDLGFAWTTLDDGTEISFVDVPGHERYLKNMLAGIEAIDVALFVVAADEGWMPQSEEHLAVLDLLGIDSGVIAVTKVDKVDADLVELATLEISDHLSGTSLADAPILPVSAHTGLGLDELRSQLSRLVDFDDATLGRPRLWIDRAFTISGAGTVVTGTLLDGPLKVEDRLDVLPAGTPVRVRGIQSHEDDLTEAPPRRRVAINLAGIGVEEVPRGSMLGRSNQWDVSDRFSATISKARYVEDLTARGAYQVHLGSAVYEADLQRIDGSTAVIRLNKSVPITSGDRFILRDTGRRLVVAGGRVLDPNPGSLTEALESAHTIDPSGSPDQIADALLGIRERDKAGRLAAHSRGGVTRSGKAFGEMVMTVEQFDVLGNRAIELTEEEIREHPLRDGLPLATLAEALDLESEVVEEIVDTHDRLERRGPNISVEGHHPELGPSSEAAWEQARATLSSDLAVPRASDLGLSQEELHFLIRAGQLVQISPEIVFLPDQIEHLTVLLRDLPTDFTVSEFRDTSGLSRKYAVPFLEWTDKEGLTVRRGDTRHVR